MGKLQLGNSEEFALIDDDLDDIVGQFNWHKTGHGYASTAIQGKARLLHRFVMGANDRDCLIDHINGNKLDNRRENLRRVNASQNAQNARKRPSTTGFLGVFHDRGYLKAAIKINGKKYHLGNFTDPVEAAIIYDDAAVKAFGKDARTNFRNAQALLERLSPDGKEARNALQRKGKKRPRNSAA